MTPSAEKFYLHVTAVSKSISIERRPFFGLTIDQLRPLIGDQTGRCCVEITRRLTSNPCFVIITDDNFNNKGWPVTTVINDRWFRGALVVLAERNRDIAGRPFIGDTFLDGLSAEECAEVTRWIGLPPNARPPWPLARYSQW